MSMMKSVWILMLCLVLLPLTAAAQTTGKGVISGTVVAAKPCSANSSTAARSSRSRASGRHLLTGPV